MNLCFFINPSFWKFLSKSTNQHGVHSPFVYHLITQCFYKNNKGNLLQAFVVYLDMKTIYYEGQPTALIKELKVKKAARISEAQLIYVTPDEQTLENLEIILENLKNNSVICCANPYENPSGWLKIQEMACEHVIVDIYQYGFIFRRDQQVAECFKIRVF